MLSKTTNLEQTIAAAGFLKGFSGNCRLLTRQTCSSGKSSVSGRIHPKLPEVEITRSAERTVRRHVIPPQAFYQFRLAFERTQAKGSFKVMPDAVAERLDADIILPVSSVKPEYKGKPAIIRWLTGSARTFRGPVVLGIREVSRNLEFRASYTLVEHAPADSIELEIKPYALNEIEKVRAAFEGKHFEALFELLGNFGSPGRHRRR